jgi:ribosome-binding factor A
LSHRLEKINSLLERELGAIILREIEFPANILVTILAVKITEDHKQARVIISVFPFDKSELALEILNKNIYHIQQILNKKLRMRPVPKIFFRADATEENAGKVEILLKND